MLILLVVLAVVVVLAAVMSFGSFGYSEGPMVRRVVYRRRPVRHVVTEHHVVEDAPLDPRY